jgi:hypothetical protein
MNGDIPLIADLNELTPNSTLTTLKNAGDNDERERRSQSRSKRPLPLRHPNRHFPAQIPKLET